MIFFHFINLFIIGFVTNTFWFTICAEYTKIHKFKKETYSILIFTKFELSL